MSSATSNTTKVTRRAPTPRVPTQTLEEKNAELQRRVDALEALMRISHFGTISSRYTGSHAIGPYWEIRRFYEIQHELDALDSALADIDVQCPPPDTRGRFYKWPIWTKIALESSIAALNDEAIEVQQFIATQAENQEQTRMLETGQVHAFFYVRRRAFHRYCRFIYVVAFTIGIASAPIAVWVAIYTNPTVAMKVTGAFLWITTFTLLIRLFEAYFLLGGMPHVLRGWQDRMGFWASWILLVLFHAAFFVGIFEKIVMRYGPAPP